MIWNVEVLAKPWRIGSWPCSSRSYPVALHNNCSGKHTGFLTLAMQRQFDLKDIYNRTIRFNKKFALFLSIWWSSNLKMLLWNWRLFHTNLGSTLEGNCQRICAFFNGDQLTKEHQLACEKLRSAMVTEPYFVAGTDRHCTRVMKALGKCCL